jgi:hypothetical protein
VSSFSSSLGGRLGIFGGWISASIFLVSLFLTFMKPALAVSREGAYPAVSKLQLLSSKGSSITSIIQLKAMKQPDSSSERQ